MSTATDLAMEILFMPIFWERIKIIYFTSSLCDVITALPVRMAGWSSEGSIMFYPAYYVNFGFNERRKDGVNAICYILLWFSPLLPPYTHTFTDGRTRMLGSCY